MVTTICEGLSRYSRPIKATTLTLLLSPLNHLRVSTHEREITRRLAVSGAATFAPPITRFRVFPVVRVGIAKFETRVIHAIYRGDSLVL